MTNTKIWMLRGGRVFRPAPFGIMGIVNLTPDSFYDGGHHSAPEAGVAHAQLLLEQGADILDLGAESSRPGAAPVSVEEEQARLLPVLRALSTHTLPCTTAVSCTTGPSGTPDAPDAPDTPGTPGTTGTADTRDENTGSPLISVDTYHAATAAAALEAGAHIINDISACAWDPALLDVVAQWKPGYVLMHSQGDPQSMQKAPHYVQAVDEVVAFLETNMARLTAAGLPESHIVLDPGIGFGKRLEHNLDILRHIDRLLALGRPVLMGLSMKSLFADFYRVPRKAPLQSEAALGTQTATALLAAQGVTLHRVHQVAETRRTLSLVQALM